ncbi:unnamed protein product [Macrosiphum euphorbiae]|uniref:ABC transmembrane type-1 domain-containing protein n=1 Tax=Macrosiphum euphorbiae TaxID=13131 RepID=A0AAV0VLJ8_9HEMI|nr:unnamed protein product [Macrosiphum euphorbiae]
MELSGMDRFCGSTFWDWNLSWNTTDPDVTPCFEKTFLVWTPCLFLWLFSPLEIYYLVNSKYREIPWNWLNMGKVAGVTILSIISITDVVYAIIRYLLGMAVFNVDIYTPFIKLITFGFASILICANPARGIRSSGLIFLFWLFLAFFGMVQYRTELRLVSYDVSFHNYPFISYMVYYPIILIEFVLSFFADAEPRKLDYEFVQGPCPEMKASFPSKILFSWFDSFAWSGYKRPIEFKNLWNMNYDNSSQEIVRVFDKHWERSLVKAKLQASKNVYSVKNKSDGSVIELSPEKYSLKNQYKVSILPVLCKSFGSTFLFGSFLKLTVDSLMFVSPQVLKYLISFVENSTEPLWRGYFYIFLLMMTTMLQTLFSSQYFHRMYLVAMRVRTALTLAIYHKALRISNTARKSFTTGEIVNLMAVDANRFIDLITYLNMVWSAPLQIFLAVYFLWQLLGPSALAGLFVMISLIPINGAVVNKSMKLQVKQMTYKDQRLKLMNEILSGIKVLKLYAWEPCFEQKVLDIRGKEISVLRSAVYLNAATSFICTCAPLLVSLVTFAVYVLSDDNHILDTETAFVSLSLFHILRYPLSMLPKVVSNIVEYSTIIENKLYILWVSK